jgi:hypothetical protein
VWSKTLKSRDVPRPHIIAVCWADAHFGGVAVRWIAWGSADRINGKRGAALETTYGCMRGAKPWRANPKGGSGTKQDRQARGM